MIMIENILNDLKNTVHDETKHINNSIQAIISDLESRKALFTLLNRWKYDKITQIAKLMTDITK